MRLLRSGKKERTADVERIEARIAALATRPPPRVQPSESDQMLRVVGGYGRLVKAAAIECVSAALDGVDGFVEIDDTRLSAVPRVILARFESPQKLGNLIRGQKHIESFDRF